MTVLHHRPKPPQLVKTGKALPIVVLTSLKLEHQQQIWHGVKKEDPALAGLLENDTAFKRLKAEFDGRLVMDRADAERYYRAGKNND